MCSSTALKAGSRIRTCCRPSPTMHSWCCTNRSATACCKSPTVEAIMTIIRLLAVATLLAAAQAARAEYILSVPDGAAFAGAPLRADLTILNESDTPLHVELPASLHARLETTRAVAALELAPDRSGEFEIAPRQFLKVALRGGVPEGVNETETLTLTGLTTKRVAVHIAQRDT